MAKKDPRIDAYINKSAPFARPILKHLRKIVHAGCPAVEETIKWQFPYFEYKDAMCFMAAFTAHCAFGFRKGALILGGQSEKREAMGHFGRIQSIADLPDEKTLIGYVRQAAALNEAGVKMPRAKPRKKPAPVPPLDLAAALRKSARAKRHFDGFSPSHKREYIEWITEAQREETRKRRVKTAAARIAQGKVRS